MDMPKADGDNIQRLQVSLIQLLFRIRVLLENGHFTVIFREFFVCSNVYPSLVKGFM
jgi:hypothetical protein